MREGNIQRAIQLAVSKIGVRTFRNNVGKCWIGKSVMISSDKMIKVQKGDVVIKQARRFHAGLTEGSSDLIGWKSVVVTEDMIGKKLAVFISLEVKTPKGRPTEKQLAWIAAVNKSGGIASVVRSEVEALDLLDQ